MEFSKVSDMANNNVPVDTLLEITDTEERESITPDENECLIVKLGKNKIKQNKNFLVVITGATGSGKSYAALRWGECMDKEFNVNRIAFTAKEFIYILQQPDLKSGSVIVFDEAGVGLSSREWYSVQNKLLNAIMQTFRWMNLVVIFTVPDFSFVDSQARKLFHMFCETDGINRQKRTVRLKPFIISVSKRTGKIYMPYPRFSSPDGVLKLERIDVHKPSRTLCNAYEAKKKYYGKGLIKEAEEIVNFVKGDNPSHYTRPLLANEQQIYDLRKQGLKNIDIAKQLDRPVNYIAHMVNQIKNKGHELPSLRHTREPKPMTPEDYAKAMIVLPDGVTSVYPNRFRQKPKLIEKEIEKLEKKDEVVIK
jgi:hypothetical protein